MFHGIETSLWTWHFVLLSGLIKIFNQVQVLLASQFWTQNIIAIGFQEGRMRGQAFVTFPSVELAHRALVCILQNAIWCASLFSGACQLVHIVYFVTRVVTPFPSAILYDTIAWTLSHYYNAVSCRYSNMNDSS